MTESDVPADEPPADEPPADEPPADEPPADEPPADDAAGAAFSFQGKALKVLPLHLVRLAVLGALCLTLPFGLGQAAVLEVRAFFAPLGLAALWQGVEEAINVLPLISTGFVGLLLLVLWGKVKGWMLRYRISNTFLFGEPLEHRSSCNPLPSWIAFLALVFTLGLAAPWIFAWQKRGYYGACQSKHGPLVFNGSGLGIAWYGLLSFLSLPFVILTLGLAWIPIRFMWVRWEQSNLRVPDEKGELRPTRFTGTLLGYVRGAFVRWVLTIVTLGLHRPWGMVATWRWTAEHTEIQ